jgi:hypothetical protein
VDRVKVDPFAPQLLIDYTYFCDRFGPLPFGDFVAMWHAADALMQAAADAGYEPHEVPDLLITADNPRMAFIRATVACIRPNIGRMLSRAERGRRWRTMGRGRHAKRSSPSIDT